MELLIHPVQRRDSTLIVLSNSAPHALRGATMLTAGL